MLFVISAPSGAGKTTIIKKLFKKMPGLKFSVSATTRPKRTGEKNEIDYYFISKDQFKKKIDRNEFIEWEQVFGDYYGTLKSEVDRAAEENSDMVFDVDVLGALSIKKLSPQAVTIFIDAPREDLVRRLKERNTDTEQQIEKRIKRMDMELDLKEKLDYTVTNRTNHSGIEDAVKQIIEIINKSKNNIN